MTANYVLAKQILARPESPKAKRVLVFGIVANLVLLGIYKYLGFLTININALFDIGLPPAVNRGAHCPPFGNDAAISKDNCANCPSRNVLRGHLLVRSGSF